MAERAIAFSTDLAVLAVFDPKVLQHRTRHPKTWWRDEATVLDVPEVLEGKLALFPIGHEGSFALRLSLDANPLDPQEQKLCKGTVGGLGILVTSEDVFAGAAERLPGDGIGDRVVEIPDTGKFWKVPPGEYDATVHVLDWRTTKDFFNEDGEPLPSAPPDFVVQLLPRARTFDAPNVLRSLMDLVPKAEVKPSLRAAPPPARRPVPVVPRLSSGVRSSTPVVPAPPAPPEPPAPPAFGPFDYSLVKRAFREVVAARRSFPDPTALYSTIVLKPRDASLQSKDIDVADLLGKVTRIRDQLRVFEQKINSSDPIEDEIKLELDSQVTRVYEALCELLGLLT